jgi:hypothetical protein
MDGEGSSESCGRRKNIPDLLGKTRKSLPEWEEYRGLEVEE